MPLAPYTTLHLGGPAARVVHATTADEVVATVAAADRAGEPLFVLGGGSNVVVPDEGFAGTVVRLASRGVETARAGDRVRVRVQAGEDWEPLVAECVARELAGVECLSGIPGLVGATPIQNVGAYGQEISDTLVRLRAYDRRMGKVVELGPDECEFGYRTSAFKRSGRYVVLEVTLELTPSSFSAPIQYGELARALDVDVGSCVALPDARAAVLQLRRGKGMVLDSADPDAVSAGSFFTNPVLDEGGLARLQRLVARRCGEAVNPPSYATGDGLCKVSAAWLIDRAGFYRGYARGAVRISTKHTLALTNPNARACTAELLALAREIRDGVHEAFGVTLANEPTLLGGPL